MKLNICLIASILFVSSACTHQQDHVLNDPSTCDNTKSHSVTEEKIQGIIVNGAVFIWNESKLAWEWASSDENKDRASRFLAATKELANQAYDKSIQFYKDHSK